MTLFYNRKYVLMAVFLLLTACGGGGGGGGGGGDNSNGDNTDSQSASNAKLAVLDLDYVRLDQSFSADEEVYEGTVGYLNNQVTVRAVPQNSNATVTINGQDLVNERYTVSLLEGENIIALSVLAQDGVTTKLYTAVVTRKSIDSLAQQAYIKASNPGAGDEFGHDVAIWGETLAVSAIFEDSAATGINGNQLDDTAESSGAVYIFTRNASGTWSQQAYIKASNAQAGDLFGFSLALERNTLIVGAPFEDSAGSDLNDNNATDAGAVYVFTRSSTGTWTQKAYIKASNPDSGDRFGSDVTLEDDTLVVGAFLEDSQSSGINGDENDNSFTDSGAAYVFTQNSSGVWSQQAYLKASNTDTGDYFGAHVDLSGDTVVVGAVRESSADTGVDADQSDNSGALAGAAYVFVRSPSGTWSQQAYIKASNAAATDQFGAELRLSGDTLVVNSISEDSASPGINGDQTDNSALQSGAAYAFLRDNLGIWVQEAYIKSPFPDQSDLYGSEIGINGDFVFISATSEDSGSSGIGGNPADDSLVQSGGTFLYARNSSGLWSLLKFIKASNPDEEDAFGFSLATHGDTVAISARSEDSNASGINGNQASNTMASAGAVYIFN